MASSPTIIVSLTADMRLLIAMLKVPPRVKSSGFRPGTFTATFASISAASPSLSTSRAPVPSVTTTIPRMLRPTLFAPTFTTLVPAAVVERSKTKSPVKVTPRISRSRPSTSARRKGPAGRFTGSISTVDPSGKVTIAPAILATSARVLT